MNTQTTINQWNTEAPKIMKIGRKTYTAKHTLTTDNAVQFVYAARKAGGEMLASKAVWTVKYDRASDLYDVDLVLFDGATLEDRKVHTWEGVFWTFFADAGVFANLRAQA